MGTFAVTLGVADPQGRRYEDVEVMVDSGATYTVLPASILEGLGVAPHESRGFVLADGSRVERGFGETRMRLDGRQAMSPVVFWDEDSMPLLGAVTLEIFGLAVDPVNGRLVPVDAFMLAAVSNRGLGLSICQFSATTLPPPRNESAFSELVGIAASGSNHLQ